MSRMSRKYAVSLEALIDQYLREHGLKEGIDRQRIFNAWDEASGAAKYSIKKFYRDGKLYITLDSSVVRSQLLFQKKALIEKINSLVKGNLVTDIILK